MSKLRLKHLWILLIVLAASPAQVAAEDSTSQTLRQHRPLQMLREQLQRHREAAAPTLDPQTSPHSQTSQSIQSGLVIRLFEGRQIRLYLPRIQPSQTPYQHLLLVLHGGMGNAQSMHEKLNMDELADTKGILVAYLSGTSATRLGGDSALAWNAGHGCCGNPARQTTDDLGHISRLIQSLRNEFGIPTQGIWAVGHSNGAMMVQTLLCETSLISKGVSLAGAMMADAPVCRGAQGRSILAIHGENDRNVPYTGGKGSEGLASVAFTSEADSQAKFQAGGGQYQLELVASGHDLNEIQRAYQKQFNTSLIQRISRFFGLE